VRKKAAHIAKGKEGTNYLHTLIGRAVGVSLRQSCPQTRARL
jgi:hypothetical protein